MPIPTSALTTNCTLERCTRRRTSSATAAPTLTARASRSSRVVSQTTVNMSVGTAASSMPRRPPRALASWARTSASTVVTEASWSFMGSSLTTARSWEQLVARVVQDAGALVGADPALDLDRAARLDAGDPAPAEPDHGDDAGAVVELGLEHRYAGPGAQGDGPQ